MQAMLYAAIGMVLANGFQASNQLPEPNVGDPAPLFELKMLKEDKTFKLQSNFGKKPTVLIFGSYT